MSVAFRLDYGTTSFLFTGDAEITQERELKERYGDFLDTDFLKAGHHGSKTSSTYPFLQYITPELSVTSLAFNNRFSHPHREAVSNLHRIGSKNYFTSLSGALIFSSNGKFIEKVH
jgi:competence protein ComEC